MPQVSPTAKSIENIQLVATPEAEKTFRAMELHRRQKINELTTPKKQNFDSFYTAIFEWQKKSTLPATPLKKSVTLQPTQPTVPVTPPSAPSPTTVLIHNVVQQQIPTVAHVACDGIYRKLGEYMAKNPNDIDYVNSWRNGYSAFTCRVAATVGLSIAANKTIIGTPPNQQG